MIRVLRLAPGGQWDQNMLDQLFSNQLYPTGVGFENWSDFRRADGLVLMIPGRYYSDRVDEINHLIEPYSWVLVMLTSDEENWFDISKVNHRNIKWWVQTPRVGRSYGDARLFGVGFPRHFNNMPVAVPTKDLDIFLSAQKTHQRRVLAFDVLSEVNATKRIEPTEGFTQGMAPEEYADAMLSARVAPAPSGAVSPDSFRLYEALESHCIPIADDVSPIHNYDSRGYWQALFPDAPFPIVHEWSDLPDLISDQLASYPTNANRIAAWWMKQKREFGQWLREDLTALGVDLEIHETDRLPITVIITASPIKSHPDTRIIDETIGTVRKHLPDCEIILALDGVRQEQESRRTDYEEYIRRVLWKADHEWKHVLPLIFDEHLHQAVATKRALEYVRTPLILFVEADTPLIPDRDIDWQGLCEVVLSDAANSVRFHHESHIPEDHKHLMLDQEPQEFSGVPMVRTAQWSQRPQLAKTEFYRDILAAYFPNDEKNFIEDVVYGPCVEAFLVDGEPGWNRWKTWIYHPTGDIRRSYHTDGRDGEEKFVV